MNFFMVVVPELGLPLARSGLFESGCPSALRSGVSSGNRDLRVIPRVLGIDIQADAFPPFDAHDFGIVNHDFQSAEPESTESPDDFLKDLVAFHN